MEGRAGRLVVCPTPIGNLEDVTLRVLRVLGEADVVACEDTRHTRKLLDRHGIEARLAQLPRAQRAPPRGRAGATGSRRGEVVALVSDAGTPGVSDPGFVLVRECLARGLPVEVLPGPTAVGDGAGRLGAAGRAVALRRVPAAQGGRAARRARARRRDAGRVRVAGRGSAKTLALLAEIDPEREVAVCRELTKVHEEVVRGHARARSRERFADGRARRDRAGDRARPRRPSADAAAALEAVEALVDGGRAAPGRGEGRLAAHRRAGEPACTAAAH